MKVGDLVYEISYFNKEESRHVGIILRKYISKRKLAEGSYPIADVLFRFDRRLHVKVCNPEFLKVVNYESR